MVSTDATITPTSLNTFADCPRCFYMARAEDEKRPTGPFPSLMSGIDEVLKEYFDTKRAAGNLPSGVRDVVGPDTTLACQRLVDHWRDWRSAPTYVDSATGVKLRGAVDDLLRVGGKVAVLDYKTRGSLPHESYSPEWYIRQLESYALMLDAAGGEVAETGYLLYAAPEYINKRNKPNQLSVSFGVTIRPVNLDIETARDRVTRAGRTLTGQCPPPDPGCEYCSWPETVASRISPRHQGGQQ